MERLVKNNGRVGQLIEKPNISGVPNHDSEEIQWFPELGAGVELLTGPNYDGSVHTLDNSVSVIHRETATKGFDRVTVLINNQPEVFYVSA